MHCIQNVPIGSYRFRRRDLSCAARWYRRRDGRWFFVRTAPLLFTLKKLSISLTDQNSNFRQIPKLVSQGRLDIATVDTAVSRVLRAKFEMGLFENPYSSSIAQQDWSSLVHTSEAVEVARTLDRESIVLLENHNNTLPLRKGGSIAVIGPMAHGFMNVGCPYRNSNFLVSHTYPGCLVR